MPISLTARERSHLKARAHSLEPSVLVGHGGLTDGVAAEIDRALKARELIKVKILAERDERDGIAVAISTRTDAAIVQQVGKVMVFWRPKLDETP
ncbi:MAG: ribosome assembly RNA-binding protein YhbY [Vicinamibacterales bacterium]